VKEKKKGIWAEKKAKKDLNEKTKTKKQKVKKQHQNECRGGGKKGKKEK